MLIHELNRLRGKTVDVLLGDPIPYEDIAHIKSRKALISHLREHTYALGGVSNSPVVNLRWYKDDE